MKRMMLWMLLLVGMVSASGCMPVEMCSDMVMCYIFQDKVERAEQKMERMVYKDTTRKRYDQALQRIERFKQKYPDMPSGIRYNMVSAEVAVYEAQERYDTAIKTLEQSLTIDPMDSYRYVKLGKLYIKQKQDEKAEDAFKKARELEECDFQMDRAYAYQDAGINDKAIEIYSQLIARFPDYSIIYYRLGSTYRLIGDIKQAIFNYDQALKINPDEDDCFMLMSLGSLYAVIGEREKAREVFKLITFPSCVSKKTKAICEYLDSDSYNKSIQENMESIKTGDANVMISYLQERLKKDPNDAVLHFNLGVLYSIMEKEEDLDRELKEVVRISPISKEAKLLKLIRNF